MEPNSAAARPRRKRNGGYASADGPAARLLRREALVRGGGQARLGGECGGLSPGGPGHLRARGGGGRRGVVRAERA